jgi:hypothetical protein
MLHLRLPLILNIYQQAISHLKVKLPPASQHRPDPPALFRKMGRRQITNRRHQKKVCWVVRSHIPLRLRPHPLSVHPLHHRHNLIGKVPPHNLLPLGLPHNLIGKVLPHNPLARGLQDNLIGKVPLHNPLALVAL